MQGPPFTNAAVSAVYKDDTNVRSNYRTPYELYVIEWSSIGSSKPATAAEQEYQCAQLRPFFTLKLIQGGHQVCSSHIERNQTYGNDPTSSHFVIDS